MKQMNAMQQSAPGVLLGFSMTDLIAILSRGKWRILSIFGIVVGLVLALTLLMKPTYETTASVLVDTRQSASALFQDVRLLGMSVDVIQNELAILSSRSMAEEVASRLIARKYLDQEKNVLLPIVLPIEGDTLYPNIASAATVIARMGRTVTFSAERESYVITITAISIHPKEASLVANTYAESYADRSVFASRSRSRSFREFLGAQLNEKRDALRHKEDSLQLYMQRSGVVSIDDETRGLMEQMATLEAQRDAAEIEIRSLTTTLDSYASQIEEQEKNIARFIGEASDPYIRLLQEQLANLEVQRDITLSQNRGLIAEGLNSERMKEIDSQINDLRKKLQERTQLYIQNILPSGSQAELEKDPTGYLKEIKQKYLETQIAIQTWETKRDALEESIRPYERRFGAIPAKSIQFARMTREKASLEQLYSLLETKYNEANVTEQSEFGYVEMFDPAPIPIEPSSPNVLLNILLAIVLGSGIGFAYVFTREIVAHRIYSPEDLIKRGFLPLSTVGALDQKGTSAGPNGQTKKQGTPYQIALTNSYSAMTEAFRHLRTNLLAKKNGDPVRTIMVTSPDPREGKTTVACNLAVVLAQGGKKVLLVDADMREPAVHKGFGLDQKSGLAQILSGKTGDERLIRETSTANLNVLCSGQSPVNPAELLESADMKFLVSQLSDQYDLVIFDSPPVLAVTDPLILSSLVDGVIIVVSAGSTQTMSLERGTEMLRKVGANLLGVVLNNFNMHKAYGFLSTGSGYGYYGYAERYGNVMEGKKKEPAKSKAT
jgi:tyrosine-protein kinase Etk/Wzc